MPRLPGRRRSGSTGPGRRSGSSSLRGAAATPAAGGPGRRARAGARVAQMQQAWSMTRAADPKLVPIVLGAAVGVFVVLLLIGFGVGHPIWFGVFGLLLGLLVGLSLFGRRAQAVAYSQVEGQPGAAVSVVQNMRGFWRVAPAVQVNRQQDVVHRVLGRPGVVLIGEGAPQRLPQLISNERRRIARASAETPVYDVTIGDGAGQVPLRKLQSHLTKLPRNLKPADVRQIEDRMRALGAARPPIPQGPMPRGARMPRGRAR